MDILYDMDHNLNISYTGLVQFLVQHEKTQFLQIYWFQITVFLAFWYFYCRCRFLGNRVENLENTVEEAVQLITEIGEEVDDMMETEDETNSGETETDETDSNETDSVEDPDYVADENETNEE